MLTLALTPAKSGSKSQFVVFMNKIQVQSKSATNFLCVKSFSGIVVVERFLYLTVYKLDVGGKRNPSTEYLTPNDPVL